METTNILVIMAGGFSLVFLVLSFLRTITTKKIYKILLNNDRNDYISREQNYNIKEPRKSMIPKVRFSTSQEQRKVPRADIEEDLGEIPEPYNEPNEIDYKQKLRMDRQKAELEREYNEKLSRLR